MSNDIVFESVLDDQAALHVKKDGAAGKQQQVEERLPQFLPVHRSQLFGHIFYLNGLSLNNYILSYRS